MPALHSWYVGMVHGSVVALLLTAACGVSDRNVTPESSGGTAGNGGAGSGGGGLGGAGFGGIGGGGSAGEAGVDACSPACADPTPVCENGACVACQNGAAKCTGDAPVTCVAGEWQTQPACSGDKPVCTNGVCAGARGSGTLSTVRDGVLAPASGNVRLVDHGFERLPRACGPTAAGNVCVTGRINP